MLIGNSGRRLRLVQTACVASSVFTGAAFASALADNLSAGPAPAVLVAQATGPANPAPAAPLQAPAAAPTLDIPPVASRPITDACPCLKVNTLRLDGAHDRPNNKIRVAEVQEILHQAVAQQPQQGYSVSALQGVADKVTEYYHKHGLVLAQAFVPAQNLDADGSVTISVVEGKLGRVRVEGNHLYKASLVQAPFQSQIGQPVDRAVLEGALVRMSQYPGFSGFGVLQPGVYPGDADLVVKVQNERRVTYDLGADDLGLKTSGEYRALAGINVNNLLGVGDVLHLTAQYGFKPSDSAAKGLYGGAEYDLPLGSLANELRVRELYQTYQVGGDQAAVGLKGVAATTSIEFDHDVLRTRASNATVRFGMTYEDAKAKTQDVVKTHDRLTVGNLGIDLSFGDSVGRGATAGSLTVAHGFAGLLGADKSASYDPLNPTPPSRLDGTPSFTRENLDLQRLQPITTNNSFLIHAAGQFTSSNLVALEQYSFGGLSSVRAYPTARYLADKGQYYAGEFTHHFTFASGGTSFARAWLDALDGAVFYDYGSGHLNSVVQGVPDHLVLAGYGASVRLGTPGYSGLDLTVAKPTSSAPTTAPGLISASTDTRRSTQFWARVAFHF